MEDFSRDKDTSDVNRIQHLHSHHTNDADGPAATMDQPVGMDYEETEANPEQGFISWPSMLSREPGDAILPNVSESSSDRPDSTSNKQKGSRRHRRSCGKPPEMGVGPPLEHGPSIHDVVMGQGPDKYDCPASSQFRELGTTYKGRYMAAEKNCKRGVAMELLENWSSVHPASRLVFKATDGRFYTANETTALNFAVDRLREKPRTSSRNADNTQATGCNVASPVHVSQQPIPESELQSGRHRDDFCCDGVDLFDLSMRGMTQRLTKIIESADCHEDRKLVTTEVVNMLVEKLIKSYSGDHHQQRCHVIRELNDFVKLHDPAQKQSKSAGSLRRQHSRNEHCENQQIKRQHLSDAADEENGFTQNEAAIDLSPPSRKMAPRADGAVSKITPEPSGCSLNGLPESLTNVSMNDDCTVDYLQLPRCNNADNRDERRNIRQLAPAMHQIISEAQDAAIYISTDHSQRSLEVLSKDQRASACEVLALQTKDDVVRAQSVPQNESRPLQEGGATSVSRSVPPCHCSV
jgi:hypothetical protein